MKISRVRPYCSKSNIWRFTMFNERYPENTIICKNDFDEEHCQRILSEASQDYSMHEAFSKVAQKATEDCNFKQAKIYWLLVYATSMILSPENKSEPFKPLAVFQDCRCAILDDFSEEDIIFFSEIIEIISNKRLQARLADLVWLKIRKVNYALMAIDSYRKIAIDKDTSVKDSKDCWCRAFKFGNYG